jgi:hypothetical protein
MKRRGRNGRELRNLRTASRFSWNLTKANCRNAIALHHKRKILIMPHFTLSEPLLVSTMVIAFPDNVPKPKTEKEK